MIYLWTFSRIKLDNFSWNFWKPVAGLASGLPFIDNQHSFLQPPILIDLHIAKQMQSTVPDSAMHLSSTPYESWWKKLSTGKKVQDFLSLKDYVRTRIAWAMREEIRLWIKEQERGSWIGGKSNLQKSKLRKRHGRQSHKSVQGHRKFALTIIVHLESLI